MKIFQNSDTFDAQVRVGKRPYPGEINISRSQTRNTTCAMYILSANIYDLISLRRFCPEKWKLQLLTVVKIMVDYLLMRTSWYSLETISGICDAGYEMFSLKNRFSFRMHSHWRSSESSKLFLTHERVESLGNWENLGISAINLGFVCLHFETTAEISL